MSCRTNTSASPPLWRPPDPRAGGSEEGGQRWGQTHKGHVAPSEAAHRNRGRCRALSAARSDAPRHLVGTARLRGSATTGGDEEGRRFVPPPSGGRRAEERAGATPTPGPLRSPGADPEGSLLPALPDRRPPNETNRKASIHVSVPPRIAPRNVTLI